MRLPIPVLDHVCDLAVRAGDPVVVGPVPTGIRRVIPVVGGTMSGPLLDGLIVGHGADWQTVRNDGSVVIDARYLLRTTDGADIEMTDRGFRHGPPDVMKRLAAGDPVDPSEYTMRTSIRLETADERYGWVNHTTFVGTGGRLPEGVVVSVFAVR
ncbi:MAG: DUF3237 domain-containing protein [Ilumatobacteraceae bacterium]